MRLSERVDFQDHTLQVCKPIQGVMVNGEEYVMVNSPVNVVRCNRCKRLHKEGTPRDLSYITIVGNVHANSGGGILGNGDWDKNKVPVYHFCPECLIDEIKDWKN